LSGENAENPSSYEGWIWRGLGLKRLRRWLRCEVPGALALYPESQKTWTKELLVE